jgi:hypothetical protein
MPSTVEAPPASFFAALSYIQPQTGLVSFDLRAGSEDNVKLAGVGKNTSKEERTF